MNKPSQGGNIIGQVKDLGTTVDQVHGKKRVLQFESKDTTLNSSSEFCQNEKLLVLRGETKAKVKYVLLCAYTCNHEACLHNCKLVE